MLFKGQEKSEGKFLKLAKRRKKTAFKSKETAERMRSDIRMPRLHVSKEHRDIRMIHL